MSAQQASQAAERAAAFFAHVDAQPLTEKQRRIASLQRRLQVLTKFFNETLSAINEELDALGDEQ